MREAALIRKIRIAVKKRWPDAYVVKLAERFHRGLPDLLIILPPNGRCILVETKVKWGKVSAIQYAEHRRIIKAGGHIMLSTELEDVIEALEILEG